MYNASIYIIISAFYTSMMLLFSEFEEQVEPSRGLRAERQRRRPGQGTGAPWRWTEVCVAQGFVAQSTHFHRVGICIIKNVCL